MRVLGVDLGSKRIGLAISDADGHVATPLQVLRRSGSVDTDHRSLAAIIDEWEVGRVVIGLPLSLDGTIGKAAQAATHEAKRLGVVTDVPIETYDERLTTVTAHQMLREQGVAGADRRNVVDMVAATVLLQAWLDGRRTQPPDDTTLHAETTEPR